LAQSVGASPARVASEGSHTPPEDRQACLSGAGCGYLRQRRIFCLKKLQLLLFYDIMNVIELSEERLSKIKGFHGRKR